MGYSLEIVGEGENIIIYGRNYSGKTTLSRILRSFETNFLDSKYGAPTFSLEMANGTILTQENLQQKDFLFRVFNKDFVLDNLKFIVDPNEKIKALLYPLVKG